MDIEKLSAIATNNTSNTQEYYGLLTKRPLIPEAQIWVFQQYDGENYILHGLEDQPLPPHPPMLKQRATTIHKFWRSVDAPWSIKLFAGSGVEITIETIVTLFLLDPVVFIEKKKNTSINKEIEDALDKILRGLLGGELRGINIQVGESETQLLAPPALSQLAPEADLSRFVQGVDQFRDFGLEVRVVVQKTDIPEAYQKLLDETNKKLKEKLSGIKENMKEVLYNLETAHGDEALREEVYRSQVGYIEQVLLDVQPTIEGVIQRAKVMTKKESLPALATTIFNDCIHQIIEQVLPSTTMQLFGGVSGVASPAVIQRIEKVAEFYKQAEILGWGPFPPYTKFRDEITVVIDDYKLRLIVPKLYPKVPPVITDVKYQGNRVPQTKINAITKTKAMWERDLCQWVKDVVGALTV